MTSENINLKETKTRIHVFDFDGTITCADSLIAFIRHARGNSALIAGLLLYSPLLVMMKLRLIDGGSVKERLFAHLFKGMTVEYFEKAGADFAADRTDILRPAAMKHIADVLAKGEKVYVVTASISQWVEPFFTNRFGAGRVIVISTQAEVKEGLITGRFATPNCYGKEKVRRLKAVLTDRDSLHITAYGDSRGDKELFDYADERFYKPFEQ